MRRHGCSPMTPSNHQGPSNLFAGLEAADLQDLTGRNHGNIKPDVSSMYHHHVAMQTRQHPHPSEMHEFLTSADPMASGIPVAALASLTSANSSGNSSAQNGANNNGNGSGNSGSGNSGNGSSGSSNNISNDHGSTHHHSPSSTSSQQQQQQVQQQQQQLHASLYGHHHPGHPGHPGVTMTGKLPVDLDGNGTNGGNGSGSNGNTPIHSVSYEPFLVNGMTLSGLHHHATAGISVAAATHQMQATFHHPSHHHHPGHHHHHPGHHHHHHAPTFASHHSPQHQHPSDPSVLMDADPRELEAFAEKFKQRRIKLGVTQADVGRALANLKLPGVGSLSQSTICRFESLTLSHNNMVALKPILQAWLEAAEAQARKSRAGGRADGPIEMVNVLPSSDKKRKRTSIAAPEKRSLEAYFALQPRPSGEKIAAIAEKLDLKKNVVRVWFCNQRQKQKRMKYSAVNQPNMG